LDHENNLNSWRKICGLLSVEEWNEVWGRLYYKLAIDVYLCVVQCRMKSVLNDILGNFNIPTDVVNLIEKYEDYKNYVG